MNVDFIAMVCNTIHLYHSYLQSKIKIPILNLRDEVEKSLKNLKSILVIATPLTTEKLYDFNNIVKPDKQEIIKLSEAILNFNKGNNKDKQIQLTRNICGKYLNSGVSSILLGCTEFAVMLKDEDIPKINTIDILVESTIKKLITFKKLKGVDLA
jgi:aspartate racemase